MELSFVLPLFKKIGTIIGTGDGATIVFNTAKKQPDNISFKLNLINKEYIKIDNISIQNDKHYTITFISSDSISSELKPFFDSYPHFKQIICLLQNNLKLFNTSYGLDIIINSIKNL